MESGSILHPMSEVKQKQIVMRTFISSFVILIISVFFIAAVQSRVITGKVTDDQGTPLSCVSVTIENTNRGTITDFNGEYRITVQPDDRSLVYSFVGMQSKKIKIKGKSVINVTLHPEIIALEEEVAPAEETPSDVPDTELEELDL